MKQSRLTSIDIIKALSIIIMVVDHIVLAVLDTQPSILQILFITYIPLCQMGFLFSSGYLMAYGFKKEKYKKYLIRVIQFSILFFLMTWLTGEGAFDSGVILMNFAISTLIGLIFLYYKNIKWLVVFTFVLFCLTLLLQILNINGIYALDNVLANYGYPINSYSIYFMVGIILFYYQKQIAELFKSRIFTILIPLLLIFYPIIFIMSIKINIYNSYQHLVALIIANTIIGFYLFFRWAKIKLPPLLQQFIVRVANALLYIYVIHYVIVFGLIKGLGMSWWWVSLIVAIIVYLSVLLKEAKSRLSLLTKT